MTGYLSEVYEAEQTLQTGTYAGETLFLGMAHTQPPGLDTTTLQADTTDGKIHSRSIIQLSRYVMGNKASGLEAILNTTTPKPTPHPL